MDDYTNLLKTLP